MSKYGTYTWHTNLETYERVIEQDAIRPAVTIAAAVDLGHESPR